MQDLTYKPDIYTATFIFRYFKLKPIKYGKKKVVGKLSDCVGAGGHGCIG